MNHDAMFKMLLKSPAVLQGFFDAFLPEVARFIDFQAVEFVDKERHTFHARKRTGDLLDWQDFDLPVYPIAVLSHKKRASGCQLPLRVDFPNKQVLHFEFDVIDLARKMAHGLTRIHTVIHGICVGPWAHLARSAA